MVHTPRTREYIDWRWPPSCVHSVTMVFSVQLGDGGGCTPSPFTILVSAPRFELYNIYNPTPSPAKLARESYLYSPTMPLFPTLCTVKNFYSVVHSETDFRLLNVKEPSIRRPRISTRLNSPLSFYKSGKFTQGNGHLRIF
jgi:hypothetical protein